MKNLKFLLLFFVFLAITNINAQQTVVGDVPKAHVIKAENGYIVFGKTDEVLSVMLYGKDLKLVNRIDQPIKKESRNFKDVRRIEGGFFFELNFCRLIINDQCEKVDFKEWTRDERKENRNETGKENMEKYVPFYNGSHINGKENAITINNKYLEFVGEENLRIPGFTMGVNNTYAGQTMIRCFSANEPDVIYSYKKNWEIALEHTNINDFKWYNLGENQLYLYVAEKARNSKDKGFLALFDNSYQAYLYKVNYNNGSIDFKYKLETKNNNTLVLSTIILDKDKNPIIIGNYRENDKPKDASQKWMDGWFAIKLNSNGKESKSNLFKFEVNPPTFYKNTKTTPKDLERLCMKFKAISYDNTGKLCIVGENIRLTDYVSGYDINTKRSTMPSIFWQNFGFSYFELDENMQLTTNDYFPNLYVISSFKNGKMNDFKTPVYASELVNDQNPKQQNKYFGFPLFYYSLVDFSLDTDNKTIVFKQKEKEDDIDYYYTLKITGPEKGKINQISKLKYIVTMTGPCQVEYYFQSPSELVGFISNKDGFTLIK